MAFSLGFKENDNGIFVGGPEHMLTFKVATGETIYPGQPVTVGAAVGEIAAADADDDVVLGIAMDNTLEGVEDFRTAYAAGEFATVNVAPGHFYMARIPATTAISAGVILKADSDANHVAADPTADEYDEVVARLMVANPSEATVNYRLARFGGVA